MANKGKTSDTAKHRPALTPEARENQMISLAVNLAEQQLRDGTASSQVITHFLKLATMREQIEKELLEKKVELAAAKTKQIEDERRTEELYAEAIEAMKRYGGHDEY